MQLTRQPAVAGLFYPGVRDQLEQLVRHYLDEARVAPHERPPKAIVVPHAGYRYSGEVAAAAYKALEPLRDVVTRVILLGPSHRVALRGLGASSAEAFLTPMGAVPIDREAVQLALRFPQVHVVDAAHAMEHSLEVQLPFLQTVLGRFSLVPFSVGDASPEDVAVVLEALWGGPETLIVISSDLSHYYDYATAQRLDRATTEAIERLDPNGLDHESACGRVPVRGLLLAAQSHGLAVETVDLRNSGDTAGDKSRVVGYGSYLFTPGPESEKPWDPDHDPILLDIARRAIDEKQAVEPDLGSLPEALRRPAGSFVTLKLDGELRGCIGSLAAQLPLAHDVARSAYRAAYHDPRFAPVRDDERPRLEVHVSVLSPMRPMTFSSEPDLVAQLQPHVDGLVLRDGSRQGTFLPDVWESLPEPHEFLRALKRKAGLHPDHWSRTVQVYRYGTRSIR